MSEPSQTPSETPQTPQTPEPKLTDTDATIPPAQAATNLRPATETRARQPSSGAQRGAVRSIHYTLSYLAQNVERGPQGAIVLLHDLPGGAFVWKGVLPQLAATGRAVYAFDLLGYGQSDHPWPSDTTNWGQADCLLYAFQAMGLRDIVLVGLGVGGSTAQTLATRLFQGGVAKLALLNTYAYEHAFAPNWPLPDMQKHRDPELAHTISVEQLQQELRQALPLGSAKGLSSAQVDTYADEWNSTVGKFMLMQHVRAMNPLYINSVASDVIKLRIPVRIIWGERDEVTPLALGERLSREAGTARLEVIKGAGHMLLDDAPDQVARLLADFVRE